ncbi:MAG: hypothetical protein EOP56_17620 [Sphingobacteriales bacterium]|nr:MAG: hypothetical protein EOP56_17620 [Sphingobacteriales bacterium]
MAVIQKIRTKYAKLAGAVIAVSLVGFIMMDAASGRFGDLFGQDSSVAKVNGEKIDIKDYSQRVKDYEVLYSYSSQGRPLDEATRAQINDQALRELVGEKITGAQAEKLGIATTKDEEKELIYSANPDPLVRTYEYFKNEQTGQFDPQRVKMFEQQINQADPSGKILEQWETLKAYIIRNNVVKKFNSLVNHSIYMPTFVAKYQLKEQTALASVRYVKVPYNTIADDQVKVSDDEMKAYMKKREGMYRIEEPTRSIEYISFDVAPSAEDTARALGTLNQIKNDFATAADAESFVNRNSDDPYNGTFVNKKTFMSAQADSIFNLPVGSVYGPYFENNTYKLTKVVEKKSLPDSARIRHILIKTEERGQMIVADSIAKRRIDSVVAAINSGASFDTMVIKVSEDDGSKTTGGEYTFTLQQRPQISKEFGDFAFEGSKGEKKTVKVDNEAYAGYHYIEILNQTGVATAAKLAVISKSLYPGETTENAAYAKASEFAGKNNSDKSFDEAAKKEGLNKRMADNIKINDFQIPGLGSSREMIRWVYDAKVGDVSQVFSMDGRYVVAKMAAKKEKGLMDLDANLRPVIEAAVRNEKKARMIVDKYKAGGALESIAQASAQTVQQADSFNASQPFIPNLGYEPKVVGYTFFNGFKVGANAPAIKGQDGVYYINLVYRGSRPEPTDPMVLQQMKAMQGMQLKNSIINGVDEMMRRSADITYNSKNL